MKKKNKKDFKELKIMIEVIHLTEEDFFSIVDSNNVKTPVYELIVRSYNESVFENFQSFFRTMIF